MRMKYLQPEKGLFRGHESFLEYLERGLCAGQGVRVYNYGTMCGNERRFIVGPEGELYGQDGRMVDPKDVLSGENGWCFEGDFFDSLPDEVLIKIFRSRE